MRLPAAILALESWAFVKTTRNAIRKPVDVAYLMNMKKYLRVSHIQYTYTRMCIYIYVCVYIYI